jgi:outer membrane protein OmpA-like peptidoglycan-associated protein
MLKFVKSYVCVALAGTMLFSSCAGSKTASNGSTQDDKMAQNGTGERKTGMSKTAKGGLLGAGAGAAIGAGIGALIGGGKGAAIGAIGGAAVGGTTGAVIGKKMDQQAADLQKDMEGVKVERVGEGIMLTMPAGILFESSKFDLTPGAQGEIDKLAKVLQKYPDTNILVTGHADASGVPAKNQTLSEQRAQSVVSFLTTKGVDMARLSSKGFGDTQPIADNATPEGRTANRRVEVAIFANEKMKKAAEQGKL